MSYFGGKGQDGVYQTIINQIPPHRHYVEPFLGGGSIMLRKRPAIRSTGLDLCDDAISSFPGVERCRVQKLDAFYFLKAATTIANTNTFIYCDPPYPISTRSCGERYNHELTDEQHSELLSILRGLKCHIAISTYPNKMYESELSDWRVLEYTSVKRSGAVAIEHLYMNYEQPEILHDDQYLGNNANHRQNIKRRIQRTKSRLLKWDTQERLMLLRQVMSELSDDELEYLELVKADLALLPGGEGKNNSTAA